MNEFEQSSFEDDSDDLDETVNQHLYAGSRLAAVNIDENPDQGARALKLAKVTGVPAPAIYGNIVPFETQTKAEMAWKIVSNSAAIDNYIREHSLASVVSNDDYGNLADFSDKAFLSVNSFKQMSAVQGVIGAVRGFGEGFASGAQTVPLDYMSMNAGAALLGGTVNTAMGLIAGVFGGATEGAYSAAKQLALNLHADDSTAENFARDIKAMTEYHFIKGEGGAAEVSPKAVQKIAIADFFRKDIQRIDRGEALPPAENAAQLAEIQDAMRAIRPWTLNGLEPPAGVHPLVDKLKAAQNGKILDEIDQAVDAAQNSLTKQRSEDLFQKFAQDEHWGDRTLGISGERVAELYKDKEPAPGDGLLGWVPGIEDKIIAARTTGQDIHVPIADWVTKVDPTVARELHDDIRTWPGGITETEAKTPITPHAVVDSPLAQVRDAAGLEPAFGLGDRKLTVESTAEDIYNEWTDLHRKAGLASDRATVETDAQARGLRKQADDLRGILSETEAAKLDAMADTEDAKLEQQNRANISANLANRSGRVGVLSRELDILPHDVTKIDRRSLSIMQEALDAEAKNGGDAKTLFEDAVKANRKKLIDEGASAADTKEIMEHQVQQILSMLKDQKELSAPQQFTVKSPIGESLGKLTIEDGKITSADGHIGALSDTIGPSAMRDLERQVQAIHPDAKVTSDIIRQAWEASQAKAGVTDPEVLDNLRAGAAGLDTKSYRKLMPLLKAQHDADFAAALKLAEKEQAKRLTAEWKDNLSTVTKEVEQNIRQRPDVAADLFVGSGEWNGVKIKQRIPLRADDLTAEQKASLPDHYYAKSGLPVDTVARQFGFTSGDAMVEKLAEYNKLKGDMSAQEMLRQLIKTESDAVMETRYGKLSDSIMAEAQDQALSETNLNRIAEEYIGPAMKAGVETIDKDFAIAAMKEQFASMQVKDVNFARLTAVILKHSRDAERALIDGDYATAATSLQKKFMASVVASEAKKFEKEQATFARTAKQFRAREVKSVSPEHTAYVQQILTQVGEKVRPTPADIAGRIEGYGTGTLQEFSDANRSMLREIPVWEPLNNPAFRTSIKEMTVAEFQAMNNTIKSLVWNGRDELKIYRAGEAAEFATVKAGMIDSLASQFDLIQTDAKGNRKTFLPQAAADALRNYYAGHLQMETILNRWDKFDENGLWNQYVMRDLIDGANQEEAWAKEYANRLLGLKDNVDLRRTVDNPIFKNPHTGQLMELNRENLRAVMLNVGTKSNLVKLAKGYDLNSSAVMDWVHQHATKEDWDFVQGIWDKVFKDLKAKSDTMYRSITGGVPAENIPAQAIDTKFGKYEGGYYPIIFHPKFEGESTKLMGKDTLEQPGFVRSTTSAGYTEERTGYTAPLALDLDMLPNRIRQIVHDVALRPATLNASKVFFDKDIRATVAKYYGDEYKELLKPYLQGVANSANYMSASQKSFAVVSEFLRQNLISRLVGLNIGTVLKHGPSALVSSMREVGPANFGKAVSSMFSVNETTGDTNWAFALKHSLELQRRERNWQETLYGATNELSYGSKYMPLRQKVMELASKPVALSDMVSAVPTWLAKYNEVMADTGVHGDAVYSADRAVRRAHGSTAITNRTALQRDSNPWVTSVYNYFSDIMNRQMETLWKAGEIKGLVKEGNYADAMKAVGGLSASLFAYVIWPSIVESFVSPHEHKPDDSWAKKAATSLAYTGTASWIGVRDFGAAFTSGHDPQFGLIGTGMQELYNVFRDATKPDPLGPQNAGKIIEHGMNLVGTLTGMLPGAFGHVARFGYDVNQGKENPQGPWSWAVGLRYGTTVGHAKTFDRYLEGARN